MTESNINPRLRKNKPEEEFNLYEILFKYLAYWPWFVVSVIICMCCTYMYLRYSTPVYSTSAKILIKEQDNYRSKSSTPLSDVMELATINLTSLFDNEVEILKSKTLIKKAVSDLGLYITHSQRRKFGHDIQLYKNSPVQVYMTPEEADKLRGKVVIKMLYDGKELTTHITYNNPKGESVILEEKFSELPASLTTEVGNITFTPADDYIPGKTVEVVAYIRNPKSAAAGYRSSMSVTPTSKNTTIANITVNNAVPRRAEDFINQLVKVYNEDANDEKNEVAKKTAELGASILNIIPLIPQNEMKDIKAPSCADLEEVRQEAGKYLEVFRHCQHCRADSLGIPGKGKDLHNELYKDRKERAADTFSHG